MGLAIRLLFLLAFFWSGAFSQNGKRYALVIGVQNYTSMSALRHSLNDARDMTNMLKEKGFEVEMLLDPKAKQDMRDAIVRYYNKLKDEKAAIGIIYYAGHGIQHDGDNYLLPTSAALQIPGDLDDQCIKMNSIMSVLNSSDNLNILLLDACRTNNIPSFNRDGAEGLKAVEAPKGSIVVFATQPGTVASDGAGVNGLFTSMLLKYINESGLNVGEVFRKVKQGVNSESHGKQLPSIVDNSLGSEFYFDPHHKPAVSNDDRSTGAKRSPENEIKNTVERAKNFFINNNFAEAARYFKVAEEKGDVESLYYLGKIYDTDGTVMLVNGQWTSQDGQMVNGVLKSDNDAFSWYKKAAEKGHIPAERQLAILYESGRGLPVAEPTEAVKWYRKAAESQDMESQYAMGRMYQYGVGVTKDQAQSIKWYKMAAGQGHELAKKILADLHID